MVSKRSRVRFPVSAPEFMRFAISIAALVLGGSAVFLFRGQQLDIPDSFEAVAVGPASYEQAAADIASRINDLSPTPPADEKWIATQIDFVENESLAYVTYTDTHNVFRLLLQTGKNQEFRVLATFEKSKRGWEKKFGSDEGAGKKTVTYILEKD